MPRVELVPVKFLRRFSMYNPGEIAGFQRHIVANLVDPNTKGGAIAQIVEAPKKPAAVASVAAQAKAR